METQMQVTKGFWLLLVPAGGPVTAAKKSDMLTAMVDTAHKTAEAMAAHESRFASLDLKFERIGGRLTLILWMIGLLIGGVASLVLKAFI
jgi:hypothetical protein